MLRVPAPDQDRTAQAVIPKDADGTWTREDVLRARAADRRPVSLPRLAPDDSMFECGTRRKYEHRGCRCAACRAANAAHKAKYERRYG